MKNKEQLKQEIYKLSALTDRGQRLNKLIAPIYQDKLKEINDLINELISYGKPITEELLTGEWELIFSNVELFRSSPFFLAIEDALDNKLRSDLFFKLHQLQVCSFGISTIGRITQKIDFNQKEFISTFDTIIFGLTTIPILGWFKLLPTFGGTVLTLSNELNLKEDTLSMKLVKTKVKKVEGLNKIPLLNNILMDRWYKVKDVWINLPWNKSDPKCSINITFLDENLRIMKDKYGAIFIYVRPN